MSLPAWNVLLAWNPWLTGVTTIVFLAICVLMVLTVLIQKPQGGGLASAFGGGGAGSGQTAFGTKTGDALTVFTIIIFALYLVFAVILNYASRPDRAIVVTPEVAPARGTPEPGNPNAVTPEAAPLAPSQSDAPAQGSPMPQPVPPAALPESPSSQPVAPPTGNLPVTNPAPANPAPVAPAPSPTPTPTTPPAEPTTPR